MKTINTIFFILLVITSILLGLYVPTIGFWLEDLWLALVLLFLSKVVAGLLILQAVDMYKRWKEERES